MKKLDLSRFHGIIPSRLSPEQRERVRLSFAATVVDFAPNCRNNVELLDGLYTALDPAHFPFPRCLGEGSTRRAYALPYGLVLKLERTDPLEPSEMEWRGSASYLNNRRRIANFNEITSAISFPSLVPKIYGFLAALGPNPLNPSALVVEQVTPLSDLRPEDEDGIDWSDLFISRRDGSLIVTDERFGCKADGDGHKPWSKVLPRADEEGLWLGNIGVDECGLYRVIDFGNYGIPGMNPARDFDGTHQQKLVYSAGVFDLYRRSLAADGIATAA